MAKKAPKAHLTGHKTKRVVIKQGDVDVKIVPVVKWLNSFESVHTLFSCEGGTREELKNTSKLDESSMAHNKPYVLFTCWDQLELMTILRELHMSVWGTTCEVTWYEPYPLRYHIKFRDKESLLHFCERKNINKFA